MKFVGDRPPASLVDRLARVYLEHDTAIKPHWSAEAFADLDTNVRQSIARILASPFIPNKDSVRGFVDEVGTGKLREVA